MASRKNSSREILIMEQVDFLSLWAKRNSVDVSAGILALHGFTGCGADFDYPKTYLPKNCVWETPNLPGLALPELCRYLRERWDALPQEMPRILLGYSMGGRIALHLARELPWRAGDKLVLISASPGISDASEREARRLADFSLAEKIESAESAEKFYAEWRKNPLIATQDRLPSPWRERLLAQRALANPGLWATHLRLLGTGTLPSLWEVLPTIPAPETWLVVGEEDKKFCGIAEKMNARIPRSRVVIVPACGHAPHLEFSAA